MAREQSMLILKLANYLMDIDLVIELDEGVLSIENLTMTVTIR